MSADDPVAAAWTRGKQARPSIGISLEQFRAHVAARLSADELADACLDDLHLACACVLRDPAAAAAFEAEVMPFIDAALSTWDRTLADETRQRLRASLLVDHAGRGPLLARYDGRGALRRWVRVVAAREAGRGWRADAVEVPVDDDVLFDLLAPQADPAVAAIQRDGAAAFKAAFITSLGELDRRERAVLRMHVLDGLTIDEIAPLYAVHRATVARWVASAKLDVLARTRKRLMAELGIEGNDVDSLIRLVQSRIELTDDELRRTRK